MLKTQFKKLSQLEDMYTLGKSLVLVSVWCGLFPGSPRAYYDPRLEEEETHYIKYFKNK